MDTMPFRVSYGPNKSTVIHAHGFMVKDDGDLALFVMTCDGDHLGEAIDVAWFKNGVWNTVVSVEREEATP